mgnify:CR=1 FL=1
MQIIFVRVIEWISKTVFINCNLKYFSGNIQEILLGLFLSLNSGCFVNGIGLDSPNNLTVKKVDFTNNNYFYLANDRINLSFVNPNEPNAFNENDFGNLSLYMIL